MHPALTTLLSSVLLPALLLAQQTEVAFETVTFRSSDKLEITADLYAPHADKKTPFIVLCHQANWSRGEYRELAPKLNAMGFNCLAIDQRSGKGVNGVENETVKRAEKKKLDTTYLDARQDIVAALKHARKKFAKGKLLVWGSSYSSALVLQIVGTERKIADGVLSFAPGEYFARFGKSDTFVRQGAKKLKVPTFITSAKDEHKNWQAIYDAIPAKHKVAFLPTTAGNHGSRALWEEFADSDQYWTAVTAFLDEHFPRKIATEATSSKPTSRKS